MRTAFVSVMTVLLAIAPVAGAAQARALASHEPATFATSGHSAASPATLASAVGREAARLAGERRTEALAARASGRQQTQSSGNWISRHPVWFGTILGAVTGTAIVGAASGAEAAFVGFWSGAAIGAATGAVVKAVR